MTDKIVALRDVERRAEESVVDMLEKLLERAKAGEISDVAAVYALSGSHNVVAAWATSRWSRFSIVGACEFLKASAMEADVE